MEKHKLTETRAGGIQRKKEGTQICAPSIAAAAKLMNVSPRSVVTAGQIRRRGSDAVNEAIMQGGLSLNLASQLVRAIPDKKEQSKLVKQGTKAIREAVKSREPQTQRSRLTVAKFENDWNQATDEEKAKILDWFHKNVLGRS